jgi:hypothetical protein
MELAELIPPKREPCGTLALCCEPVLRVSAEVDELFAVQIGYRRRNTEPLPKLATVGREFDDGHIGIHPWILPEGSRKCSQGETAEALIQLEMPVNQVLN